MWFFKSLKLKSTAALLKLATFQWRTRQMHNVQTLREHGLAAKGYADRMLEASEVRCEEILPSNWHHWLCHVDRKLGNWRPKAERMLSNIDSVNEPVWLQETRNHLTIRQVAARPNTYARYTLYPCSRAVFTRNTGHRDRQALLLVIS